MKQLDHPNVMGLIGVCIDAGPAPYIDCYALHGQWQSSVLPQKGETKPFAE